MSFLFSTSNSPSREEKKDPVKSNQVYLSANCTCLPHGEVDDKFVVVPGMPFVAPVACFDGSDPTPPKYQPAPSRALGSSCSPPTMKDLLAPSALKLMRGMLTGKSGRSKEYRMTLRTSATFLTSATGVLNSVIPVANLAAITEFASFAVLFDEFFVKSMTVDYTPVNEYQFPVGTSPSTNQTSTDMARVSLWHGATGYSTYNSLVENATMSHSSSMKRWAHTWRNNESPQGGIVVTSSTSSAVPSQGWCLTAATPAAAYTGSIQTLGVTALGTGSASVFLGTAVVSWDVLFRARA